MGIGTGVSVYQFDLYLVYVGFEKTYSVLTRSFNHNVLRLCIDGDILNILNAG